MGRHVQYTDLELPAFRKRIGMHIAALNYAVANIPAEQLRMHLCWGNYPGPHHCDVPLADKIDLVRTAKPSTILFEAATTPTNLPCSKRSACPRARFYAQE
jgi:5-methyltetrahydropteroyltriglutamate--homocysteine methyltransferase